MEKKELTKEERVARDVLILSRNTLLINLRFLDAALNQLELMPVEESSLLTDGQYLLYNPIRVLKSFKLNKETVTRDYLHIVLHCIYRHMFINPAIDRPLWDLACDIAVENVISELGLKSTEAYRAVLQIEDFKKLKGKCNMLTAEKIYAHLKEQDFDSVKAAQLRANFYADNHEIWYMSAQEKYVRYGVGPKPQNQSGEDGEDKGGSFLTLATQELSERWQKISERMQVDVETFGQKHGNQAGSLVQNLREVNREKYDYTEFLKKFAVMTETMKINDDEFDYIFYTYGMELYEDMPLIEPLEYKEVKQIREFVIAIDTSGSVCGEQVQAFVQKTYNILKSTESFHSKINLHIIQCDADIQEHVKITTQKEFDQYISKMQIKGLGGTDFRPVFAKVDELVKAKEFINLKGLIYFTDGYGEFPARKPDYDTAFVFVDDEYNTPDVPSWAIKLVLPKKDI